MRNALSPLARIIVALAAVLGLLAVAVPAEAVINSVTVVPSANTSPTEDNSFASVSCVSASWCVAVGYFENGNSNQTLIELWDGSSWSIQPSPNTSPTEDNSLGGVSCVSTTWCVAVGNSYDGTTSQTLIEVWDGTNWTIQTSANTSPTEDNQLYSVSCTSVSSCVAVGDFYNGWLQTLVQVWDGNSWSLQASPNSSATETNYLFAVSCVSSSWCVAVGAFMRVGRNQPMAQVWNGSNWSMQSAPSFSPTEDNYLEALSCVSASWCVAAGAHTINNEDVYETMVQVWDGSTWSMQASPSTSQTESNYLFGMSCLSVSFCVAVGEYHDNDYSTSTYQRSLVEVWDGSAWTIQPSPSPGPQVRTNMNSVSCVSDWQCSAVGDYLDGTFKTLVLALTGPEPPTTTTTSAPPADPVVPAFTG